MCMTYYTVDDLRPGRPGWDVRQFSALAEAIDHYRTLPMNGVRVLGMADDAHAYELIRCVRLFPGDAQGEDVLAADYRRSGLTKKNAALKNALNVCLEALHPRFLLEPERLVPVPRSRKLREELREALLEAESCGKSCGRRFSGRVMKKTTIPPSVPFLWAALVGSHPRTWKSSGIFHLC